MEKTKNTYSGTKVTETDKSRDSPSNDSQKDNKVDIFIENKVLIKNEELILEIEEKGKDLNDEKENNKKVRTNYKDKLSLVLVSLFFVLYSHYLYAHSYLSIVYLILIFVAFIYRMKLKREKGRK